MAETTNISKLIINYLTEDQYKTAKASGLINENELYVTDVQDSTTLDCFEELFTATEGQTLFILTEGTYVPNQSRLTICVNGAQQPSTAYTETSSSSFTFNSGLSAGDSIIARYVNARIVSNITLEPHKTSHMSAGSDPLTPSDIGAANSTHTHGNISNGGTIGSTPNLPIFTGINGLLETKTIADAKTLLGIVAGAQTAESSYTGTNTYGSANPNSLTFSFAPKLVIISRSSGSASGIFVKDSNGRFISTTAYGTILTTTWSSNTLSWYNETDAATQLNATGITYYYTAIG